MLSWLLDLLAPARCLSCGRTGAPLWCPSCQEHADQLRLTAPVDPSTSRPTTFAADREPAASDVLAGCVAAFRYTGVVADAVVAAKVGGAFAAWPALGAVVGEHLAPLRSSGLALDGVVPIPSEPGRVRRRGFDHTALMAEGVARRLELPVVRRALVVAPGTPDRASGRPNPGAATPDPSRLEVPAIAPRLALSGMRILLLDDVITTGTTAAAGVAALLRAGASTVVVAAGANAGGIPPM